MKIAAMNFGYLLRNALDGLDDRNVRVSFSFETRRPH